MKGGDPSTTTTVAVRSGWGCPGEWMAFDGHYAHTMSLTTSCDYSVSPHPAIRRLDDYNNPLSAAAQTTSYIIIIMPRLAVSYKVPLGTSYLAV